MLPCKVQDKPEFLSSYLQPTVFLNQFAFTQLCNSSPPTAQPFPPTPLLPLLPTKLHSSLSFDAVLPTFEVGRGPPKFGVEPGCCAKSVKHRVLITHLLYSPVFGTTRSVLAASIVVPNQKLGSNAMDITEKVVAVVNVKSLPCKASNDRCDLKGIKICTRISARLPSFSLHIGGLGTDANPSTDDSSNTSIFIGTYD